MKLDQTTEAFVDGPFTCIDLVCPDGRSEIARETLEQIRLRYPKAERVNFDSWWQAKERKLCTEPERTTKERFDEMLDVLPPQRWQRARMFDGRTAESFELSEHTSGRITAIFARFGDQYYTWQDRAGQTLEAHACHCGQCKLA